MIELTTHERMQRMYAHQTADRVPVTDSLWEATLERWRGEGLPENVDFTDYFGLDKFVSIGVDSSPQYPEQVLEKTEDYSITTTRWGAKLKNWRHMGGVPEFLDFVITGPDSWAMAKARMQPSNDRINWDYLKKNYSRWRQQGYWIAAEGWFGFDITHSWTVGSERLLMAMAEQPEWVADMFATEIEVSLGLLDRVWEAGYTFDELFWCDDMGYKGNQFFSMRMYRQLLKPIHRRAVEWAHAKGIKAHLHSCGNINPFIPELIEIGVDMINPLEVKAGMDPLALKQKYGQQLAFHGGLNAVLYNQPEALWAEMQKVIPAMKEKGGYLISSDHSVPQTVSLEDFRAFVSLAKKLGSYD